MSIPASAEARPRTKATTTVAAPKKKAPKRPSKKKHSQRATPAPAVTTSANDSEIETPPARATESSSPADAPSAPATSPASEPTPPPPAESSSTQAPSSASPMRTTGFIGLGVAGAALATGGVLAFLAANDRSVLSVRCPNDRCDERDREAVERGRARADAATIALAGGAILAAASVTLVVLSPKKETAPSVELRAAGPSLLLQGSFQ